MELQHQLDDHVIEFLGESNEGVADGIAYTELTVLKFSVALSFTVKRSDYRSAMVECRKALGDHINHSSLRFNFGGFV